MTVPDHVPGPGTAGDAGTERRAARKIGDTWGQAGTAGDVIGDSNKEALTWDKSFQ
jgi:hypothetical protein